MEKKTYLPPKLLFNGHLQTVYPAIFRKIKLLTPYVHERIITQDQDFLDLFWMRQKSDKLVIISHGLEGNADRAYVKGMANAHFSENFDVLTWNYRGCSDQLNKLPKMYHSGATEDLLEVVNHTSKDYHEIFLIGFSLGANLTLKFLGERGSYKNIKKACVIAAPLDLKSSSLHLNRLKNALYQIRFMRSLKMKARAKHAQYPGLFDLKKLENIHTIYDFDNLITAPIHGFKNADDYYEKCSSKNFIRNIQIPTQILNAMNDPFLTTKILDKSIVTNFDYVSYQITSQGGHCGYPNFSTKTYWSEAFAVNYFKS
ncbi:MAG: alpha/beta hydrolase [Flammeovirgaceae bacterium]|nr:alpha/beta hydrolase [Flammeovirgaceae bacterium]|tara:strand:- start:4985 stop:5926 length:942 start_codon:yes stop_codon:yes gene_type:complete